MGYCIPGIICIKTKNMFEIEDFAETNILQAECDHFDRAYLRVDIVGGVEEMLFSGGTVTAV